MKKSLFLFFLLLISVSSFSQKDSLNLGDRYAEDQIYVSISYSQFFSQPTEITKSNFSYGLSVGFLKDLSLTKKGKVSVALGIGYGYYFFNHKLKVTEINNKTVFNADNTISANLFKSHNLEFPLEFRWRTSTAKKYKFWRIYGGVKFMYNLANSFQFTDSNNTNFKYSNITSYNKLQYGLTLAAGYDKFNMNVFYGLSPVFKNATINGEKVDTKIIKFGLIFYIL